MGVPKPLNVYGRSKLEGERAIWEVGGRHLILRTSWVYGLRGRNFFLTMLRLLQERSELSVVQDQHGAPTWSRLIAEATSGMLVKGSDASGIYHMTSAGSASWYEFTLRIAALLQGQGKPSAVVKPIPSSKYPTPAQRPSNSLLASDKLERDFGLRLPEWLRAMELAATDLMS